MKITEALNVLPRLSYRWLKVNHFRFEEEVELPIKTYTLDYLPQTIDPRVKLNSLDPRAIGASSHPFGASGELVRIAEEHANAGFRLQLPQGAKVVEPIRVKYRFDQENNSVIDHNLIVAEKDSSITVLVDYFCEGQDPVFHNGVTKIFAEQGAEVTLIKIQRLNEKSIHLDSHYVEIAPYARVRYIQVELGGKYSITNYQTKISENGAAIIDGMYLGDGERVLDLSYHMIHKGYRSTSDILVRGALKDQSRKVFRGTLDFKRGARLSKRNEEEYVILLDPAVKSDAVPLLLSEEDDIQGGHAASAGKVDPDQLFYLMTRGLTEAEATMAIVQGSFQHVLDELPLDLKKAIQDELQRKLVSSHA